MHTCIDIQHIPVKSMHIHTTSHTCTGLQESLQIKVSFEERLKEMTDFASLSFSGWSVHSQGDKKGSFGEKGIQRYQSLFL